MLEHYLPADHVFFKEDPHRTPTIPFQYTPKLRDSARVELGEADGDVLI